eukprot:scaffold32765_cov22-Tisochrysis_lutea.AAC.2
MDGCDNIARPQAGDSRWAAWDNLAHRRALWDGDVTASRLSATRESWTRRSNTVSPLVPVV